MTKINKKENQIRDALLIVLKEGKKYTMQEAAKILIEEAKRCGVILPSINSAKNLLLKWGHEGSVNVSVIGGNQGGEKW